MTRILIFTALIFILLKFITFSPSPEISAKQDVLMDLYKNKPALSETSQKPFTIEEYEISPVLEYKITGKVIDKIKHNMGWRGKVMPFDVALAWNDVNDKKYNEYINFNYRRGALLTYVKKNSPLSLQYVLNNSSSSHIIPSNKNVYRALNKLEKDQLVQLEGSLVDMYKNGKILWKTSRSLYDTGGGACEVFYVEKVITEGNLYE